MGRFQEARLITWDVTIYHAEHDIALLGHYTQTHPKNKNPQSCSCTLPVALQKPRICASVRRSEDIDWISSWRACRYHWARLGLCREFRCRCRSDIYGTIADRQEMRRVAGEEGQQNTPWVIVSVIRGMGLCTFRLQGSNCSRSRSPTRNCSSAFSLWSEKACTPPEKLSMESESVLLGYAGGG